MASLLYSPLYIRTLVSSSSRLLALNTSTTISSSSSCLISLKENNGSIKYNTIGVYTTTNNIVHKDWWNESRKESTCSSSTPNTTYRHYSKLNKKWDEDQDDSDDSIRGGISKMMNRLLSTELLPPNHPRQELPISMHGKSWIDYYQWMNDLEDDRVTSSIQKENEYYQHYLDKITSSSKLYNKIIQENMKTETDTQNRQDEDVEGFHYTYDRDKYICRDISTNETFTLFQDYKEPLNNKLKCRDIMSLKLANDKLHFMVIARVGSESYNCYIKCIDKKRGSSITIGEIKGTVSMEWGGNDNAIYYTVSDHLKRPYKLYRVSMDNLDSPELIYHEKDDSLFLDVLKSKDNKYIFFCSNSKTSTCVYYIKLSGNDRTPKKLLNRVENLEYYLSPHEDNFLIFANNGGKDLSIYIAPNTISNGNIDQLKLLIPADPKLNIKDCDVLKEKLVLLEYYNSIPRLRIISKDKSTNQFNPSLCKIINFPDVSYAQLGVNSVYDSNKTRVYYSTPFLPEVTLDINLDSGEVTQYPLPEVKGPLNLNPQDYVSQRVFVPSKHNPDISIPLTLVHHKSINLDSNNPTLIQGYGSYGAIQETGYDYETRSLLKRGWVIATAHTRGGGELGRDWYSMGRQLQKKNMIYDFVDCVEYLFQKKYTNPSKLIASGSSAGGVLMGNMALLYGHYFKGIIARVPFLDVITSMSDGSLHLTVAEYDEWGNPAKDIETFNYIQSYDPYHLVDHPNSSIVKGTLPNLLVLGSLDDIRVPYWHPLKWVAKIRNRIQQQQQQRQKESKVITNQSSSSNPSILLHLNEHGHFGPENKREFYSEAAIKMLFMINSVNSSSSN